LRHTHFFTDQTGKLNEDAVVITTLYVYSLKWLYKLCALPREILIFINCVDREKWPQRFLVGSFCQNSAYFLNQWSSESFLLLAELSFPNAYVRTDKINTGWFRDFIELIMRQIWGKDPMYYSTLQAFTLIGEPVVFWVLNNYCLANQSHCLITHGR